MGPQRNGLLDLQRVIAAGNLELSKGKMAAARGLRPRDRDGNDCLSPLPIGPNFSIHPMSAWDGLGMGRKASPMISRMWMGWSSVAGGPAPARLMAATRRKNLSPGARFRTVCWVTIMGRAFTGTHSEAEEGWPWAPFPPRSWASSPFLPFPAPRVCGVEDT